MTEMRRLFLAITFDDEVQRGLATLGEAIATEVDAARCTLEGNHHLTLAFLGELDEAQESSARRVLARVTPSSEPFVLNLGDIGFFEKRQGSVIWRGIVNDGGTIGLMTLQGSLVQALAEEGLPLEDRPFRPHVTLMRGVRTGRLSLPDVCRIASEDLARVTVNVDEACLMWSHHREPAGPLVYDIRSRERLGRH